MFSGERTVATAVAGVLINGAVRVTMSVVRIKTWLMTAACVGLMGLVAGDAHAFCGKVFKKKDACADPCAAPAAAPCADPCAGGGKKLGGGLRDWFAGLGRGGRGWGGGAGDCGSPCGTAGGCGPAVAAPAPAPVTQKVKVTEWVPTWVDQEVTVMKPVKKTETYTAHKWECVPEVVTYQATVNKLVTETVTENRCVTERVAVQKTVTVNERVPVQKTVTVMERKPVQKTVTVNETRWTNVMVTENVQKTVTHKVQVPYCKEVGPSIGDRLKKICDPCYTPCPRTVSGCKTEKVCETVCETVTKCKKVAECVPVTKTVCSYECVPVTKTVTAYECVPVTKQITAYECVTKNVAVPVTRTRCVPTVETHTKTVNVRKCVAYQATREVTVCEPVKQMTKVCKMVATVVEKDVVVSNACATGCDNGCGSAAAARAGLFDRLKGGFGNLKGKFGCKKSNDCGGCAASGAAAGCCH